MKTNLEKQILTQLQRGIEITTQPFQTLENVDAVSSPHFQGLEVLKKAQSDGLLRRFGGVFDARRLGYKSILCAVDVPNEQLEEKAAIVSAHPGVTHCYERLPMNCRAGMAEGLPAVAGRSATIPLAITPAKLQKENHYPNLWFTLAMLHDQFDAGWEALRSKLETRNSKLFQLPALCRFKIDVVFDLAGNSPSSQTPASESSAAIHFSEQEKALVRAVDQQIPLVERPFQAVAEQIGQSEEFVLNTLRNWKEQGVLRRVGAILYHRQAGFKANAMCVWPVDGDVAAVGRRVAARPEVTHCYQRPRLDAFPFDLYAMIHAADPEKIRDLFKDISSECGLSDGELFVSGREFKKSSMKYFR